MSRNAWVLSAWLLAPVLFSCNWLTGEPGKPRNGPNRLFEAAKNTAPAFKAAPLGKRAVSAGDTIQGFADPAMLLAFQVLQDYSHPEDDGQVDATSIYKLLWEAGRFMAMAKNNCSPIPPAPDSAVSSYVFSDFLGHTYDCGGTVPESSQGYGQSVAYRETPDSTQFMLLTFRSGRPGDQHITIGAIQTRLGLATGDLDLTFAQSVGYFPGTVMGGPSGSGFATRTSIRGNSITHAFEIRIALWNSGGFNNRSLVGKGISRGAGNHFLFRHGEDYYCLPAGATAADLRSVSATTRAGVDAACAGYISGVDQLAPYELGNPAHMPAIDHSSFNGGVGGTPVKYQMF